MRTLRDKRNDAVAKAKEFAKVDRYDMAEIWIRRAANYLPLHPLQVWAFKKYLGEYKFDELGFDSLPVQER